MTDKEFRRLCRRDLLQLLVAQGKENLQLETQLEEAGSIAEAALRLNEKKR